MNALSRRGAVIADLLRSGRSARLTASGSSMAPAIRSGDTVRIAPVDRDRVRLGDIVLVRCRHELLLHRVVSTSPMRTSGDNTTGLDPKIDEVLGRVQSIQKSLYSRLRSLAHRIAR